MPTKPTIPKSLAAAADAYYTARETRLALDKSAALAKARETALKEHLIKHLPKSKAGGIAGQLVRVEIETVEIPVVDDWDKLYKYISKTRQFDLLNRALNRAAVKERWEARKSVPGVGAYGDIVLHMSKLKGGRANTAAKGVRRAR